ncbi:MAG: rod shape-determining protein MreD [Bacteroidales bacterium]|nr:rod shape-determining protein MreD [Bacteroidales bacterium]
MKEGLNRLAWCVGLVLLQVLILNHIHIAGYATPFLYIYVILKFQSDVSRNGILLWGFFLGLAVDMFSNTAGMNAIATVLLAFLQPILLRFFSIRDNLDVFKPSARAMGRWPFLRYLISGILIHHFVLVGIEYFSFLSIKEMFLRVLLSSLLTLICIKGLEGISKQT